MTSKTKKTFDPATLNTADHIVWFDDFHGDEGNAPTNSYRFLSNFYVGDPFTIPDVKWFGGGLVEFKTGEHAFQAFKAVNSEDSGQFKAIVDAETPSLAKKLGRSCKLRKDWEAVKFDVMMAVLRSKFTFDRAEGHLLLGTGTALLTEGTFWYDDTWGVMLNKQGRPGRNWLGTLLMARRAELQAEKASGVSDGVERHNVTWALTLND